MTKEEKAIFSAATLLVAKWTTAMEAGYDLDLGEEEKRLLQTVTLQQVSPASYCGCCGLYH